MSDAHAFVPIRELIEFCVPGEWGQDPIGDQFNCVVYRATDIDNDGHLDLNGGAARNVAPLKIKAKALRAGDLLLEASGGAPDKPVGRVALVDAGPQMAALTSNFFRALRPTSRVNANFLCAQLVALNRSSAIWRYQQQTTGLINLKVHDYLEHKVWVPDRGTQDRISAILSGIDTTITQTEALIAKHRQIKAGLMHDLFTRGVLPNGQLRPPREQAPHLYKQTELGWIPSEWSVSTMIDLAEKRKGATTIGPFGSDLVAKDYQVEGVPIVFVRDIKSSGFEWNSDTYVTQQKATLLDAHTVTAGDVLVTKMGLPPCLSCLYPEWMPDGVITADIIRLSPDRARVEPSWLVEAINQDRVIRQVAAITAGVTRPKVTLADFRSIKIVTPDLEEQLRVSNKLRVAQERIQSEATRIAKLQRQKLGLMHDLLTGKVQVPAKPLA